MRGAVRTVFARTDSNPVRPTGTAEIAAAHAGEAVVGVMVPGGLLIFDLNNRQGCEDRSQRRAEVSRPGWEVIMKSVFDPASDLETARVTIRQGEAPAVETEIVRRCFASEDVACALGAAGFEIECEETWSYAPRVVAGKTWYVARWNRSEIGRRIT